MQELTHRQRAYREYQATDHWAALRTAAVARDGGKCVRCGSTAILQVHHTLYRTPFEAGILSDVETLCRQCHRKEHGFGSRPTGERIRMFTWTPLFSKMVDSPVWDLPDFICKIWVTMLVSKDSDHVVRLNAYALANRAKKTEKEVTDALAVLSAPDTKRIEPQLFEGRMIQKVEDGWLILNGQKYEDMMRAPNRMAYLAGNHREYRGVRTREQKREQTRLRVQRFRAKNKLVEFQG